MANPQGRANPGISQSLRLAADEISGIAEGLDEIQTSLDTKLVPAEQQLLLKDRVMEQQLLSKDQQIRALELENERLTRLALENHGETGKAHQQANVEQPKPYTAAASPLSTPTPAPIAAYRHGFSQPSALRVDLLHG